MTTERDYVRTEVVLRKIAEAQAADLLRPYACERCGLGYDEWMVECDDCGGPVEERDDD